MPETEDGCKHRGDRLCKFLPRATYASLGRTRGCGELERSLNGECREMDVVLRTVLHIATELLVKLVGLDRIVIHLPRDRMVLCAMVRDGFEERTAT